MIHTFVGPPYVAWDSFLHATWMAYNAEVHNSWCCWYKITYGGNHHGRGICDEFPMVNGLVSVIRTTVLKPSYYWRSRVSPLKHSRDMRMVLMVTK